MIRTTLWTVILTTAAVILQSTVLSRLTLFNVVPDIALCILVYSAYINGTMTGQISGFLSGILHDFLSAAPLGLNCLIRTLTGALTGVFKGAFFLDLIFLPIILCALATLFKALIHLVLNMTIGDIVPSYQLLSMVLWIEVGMNSLLAPILFFILKKFKYLSPARS